MRVRYSAWGRGVLVAARSGSAKNHNVPEEDIAQLADILAAYTEVNAALGWSSGTVAKWKSALRAMCHRHERDEDHTSSTIRR